MTQDDYGTTSDLVSLVQSDEGVALVRLNRPDARNAMLLDSWAALEETFDAIAAQPEYRSVVLAGSGGYFSAGGDLKTPPSAGFRSMAAVGRLEAAQRTIRRITRYPLPVIAAVEGGAAGLGWSLALACDMIFTSPDARFSAPFVARGVPPDGGAAWFLVKRIGRHRAAEVLLAGRPVSGSDAWDWGLANRLVDAGSVVQEAVQFARAMASDTPHAMEATKRLITAAENSSLANYLDLEMSAAALAQADDEAGRARSAFQRAGRHPPTAHDGEASPAGVDHV